MRIFACVPNQEKCWTYFSPELRDLPTCSNLSRSGPLHKIQSVKARSLLTVALFAATSLPALPARQHALPASATADRVLVIKSQRKLYLLENGKVLKSYHVSLGGHPAGTKVREGDERTPEGTYVLDWHNPHSDYYRSIHISYPSAKDVARANRLGVPPGGDLFIHGQPNDYAGSEQKHGDWTAGCIAVSNTEMDEIWRSVADGTPIVIKR
jgi:murein L,D-transpeptidase YafK